MSAEISQANLYIILQGVLRDYKGKIEPAVIERTYDEVVSKFKEASNRKFVPILLIAVFVSL